MSCCPVPRKLQPLVFDPCTGLARQAQMNETLLVNGKCIPGQVLHEDLTVYVDPDGDDEDGGGTLDNPFRSIPRAWEHVSDIIIPDDYEINISCAEGFYNWDGKFFPKHFYGARINTTGVHQDVTGVTFANPTAITSAPAEAPELQYYDIEATLPVGGTAAIGYFLRVLGPSGGTNPDAVWGLHPIIDWDGGTRVATVRIWQRDGVTQTASGAVSSDCSVIKSIVRVDIPTGEPFGGLIEIIGPYNGGLWQSMVLEGLALHEYTNYDGTFIVEAGTIEFGNRFGFHNVDIGARSTGYGIIRARGTGFSKIKFDGVRSSNYAYLDINGAAINGAGRSGLWALNNGSISASDAGGEHNCILHGVGQSYAVHIDTNSYCHCPDIEIYYDRGAGAQIAFRALELSDINCLGATVVGWNEVKEINDCSRINGPSNNRCGIIDTDYTVVVETSGNDTTGVGSIASPFATIQRALEHIAEIVPTNNARVIIDVGDGIFTYDDVIDMQYAYGESLDIVGERTNMSSVLTLSNIDTSVSTDGSFPDLEYFDFDIDLSDAGNDVTLVEVNQFIRLKDATGGTNHDSVRGLHKIIAWDDTGEIATLRAWQKVDSTNLPSGSITATNIDVIHTVFTFSGSVDDHAIKVSGKHSGFWEWIVLEGNQNQFDARRGVQVRDNGSFIASNLVGFHQFDVGAEVFNGAVAELSTCAISKMLTIAISCSVGQVRFGFTSYCNGCGELFIWAQAGASIVAFDAIVVGAAETYCILCEKGGTVDVNGAEFYSEDTTPTTTACLRAEELANIVATSATFTNFTTNKSAVTQGRIEPP